MFTLTSQIRKIVHLTLPNQYHGNLSRAANNDVLVHWLVSWSVFGCCMKTDARIRDIPKTASLLTVPALAFSCRILSQHLMQKKSIAVKTISKL